MQQHDDEASVRHLVELGYNDPDEIAARDAAVRKQQQVELQRANELTAAGRLHEAASLLESLSTDAPDWIVPRQILAEIYYRAGRLNESQAQLDWLTYHGVEHPRLALIAGAIALGRRELPLALESLDYAAYVEPNLPSVQTLYGSSLLRLGRFDEAEDAFRQAVQQNPTDARVCDGLAAVCLRRDELDDAADWALQALQHDMRLFHAHYHLGLALVGLNRPEEAIQTLEFSARADPSRCAPYHWLSRIAKEWLNDPARAEAYRARGREVVQRRRDGRRSR